MDIELDESNFLLYASRNYYVPRCIDAEEFFDDLSRFKYIKRLLNRYNKGGELGVNLLLNHITVILNVFGYEAGLRMLEYRIGLQDWHIIKPFLIFTGALTNYQYSNVHVDPFVAEQLGNI